MQVYLITNLKNSKQYIGAEKGDNSEYLGSGKLIREAIGKFGKESFKKEILIDNKYIDSWEECLELESVCILSLNTLQPNGYNVSVWNWPLSVEILRKSAKRRKELKIGIFAPDYDRGKGGKRTSELYPEKMKEWGKIGGKKTKELEIGIFDPNYDRSKSGKIMGKKNKELEIGMFAPKWRGVGGKMNAHTLFEIDGLIQQTTLGAINRT